MIDVDEVLSLTSPENTAEIREKLMEQARDFLLTNQECYVAQWLLQNPFVKITDYRLKFVYNDETKFGYTVEMEKIPDVQ